MKIMNQQLHRVTQHIYRLGIAEGFTVQSCQIVTQPRVFSLNSRHGSLANTLITIRDKTWIYSPSISDIEIALPCHYYCP
jgi:hypothetical protein